MRKTALQHFKMSWVVIHDIGGWLFPDNPEMGTMPHEEVLELVRCLVSLWGNQDHYVVANVRSRGGWEKDWRLLQEHLVFERCGLPNRQDLFIPVNRPEEKGVVAAGKALAAQLPGGTAHVAIFDNRIRSIFQAPACSHKFLYRPKDTDEKVVSTWLDQNLNQPTLYSLGSVYEVAQTVVRVHLEAVRKKTAQFLCDSTLAQTRKNHVQALYEEEVTRTALIFSQYGAVPIKGITAG